MHLHYNYKHIPSVSLVQGMYTPVWLANSWRALCCLYLHISGKRPVTYTMQNVCGFYFCTLLVKLFSSLLAWIKDLHSSKYFISSHTLQFTFYVRTVQTFYLLYYTDSRFIRLWTMQLALILKHLYLDSLLQPLQKKSDFPNIQKILTCKLFGGKIFPLPKKREVFL